MDNLMKFMPLLLITVRDTLKVVDWKAVVAKVYSKVLLVLIMLKPIVL